MYKPQIARVSAAVLGLIILFTLATSISTRFRISGEDSPSRVLSTLQNVVLVSLAFSLIYLVIGQLTVSQINDKYHRLFTLVTLILLAVLVIREPIERQLFISYGDYETLIGVVKGPGVFARWALGSTAITSLYFAITGFVTQITVAKYLSVLSSLFVLSATYVTIRKSKGRLAFLLPLMSPMWVAFSLSYDEYNAFVAPVFLFTALWIFFGEQPKSIVAASILAGLLPAIYVGLAPISILVMLKLLIPRKNWSERTTSLAVWLVAYFGAIEFSWPAGHLDYLKSMTSEMLLGGVGGFEGKSASDKSVFLNLRTLASAEHLGGVGYMLLFGAGLAAIVFLCLIVLAPFLLRKSGQRRYSPTEHFKGVQWATLIWAVAYIVTLMAKLGPTGDVDMFYSTYIVISIVVGICLDQFLDCIERSIVVRRWIILAFAATNGPLVAGLVVFGVQLGCSDYSMVRGWCTA